MASQGDICADISLFPFSSLLTITRMTSLKCTSEHVIPLLTYSAWLPTVYGASPNSLARYTELFSDWLGSTIPASFSDTSLPHLPLSPLTLYFNQNTSCSSRQPCLFLPLFLCRSCTPSGKSTADKPLSFNTQIRYHHISGPFHPQARLMTYTSYCRTSKFTPLLMLINSQTSFRDEIVSYSSLLGQHIVGVH